MLGDLNSKSGLVVRMQWLRFGDRRCSPLGAVLCDKRLFS